MHSFYVIVDVDLEFVLVQIQVGHNKKVLQGDLVLDCAIYHELIQ
jgi:hypothetical protein